MILSSAVQAAIELFPHAEIDLLVPEPWAPLFESFPKVKTVWPIQLPKNRFKRIFGYLKLIFPLRRRSYDAVVLFHAGRASALLTLFLGCRSRSIHFHSKPPSLLPLSLSIPDQGILKPIIDRDLDALRGLGYPVGQRPMPRIFLTEAEQKWAKSWLVERNLKTPLLALGLGASRATKSWALDRFVLLASRWVLEDHGSVVVTVGKDDSELAAEFLQLLGSKSREVGEGQNLQKNICVVTTLSLRQLAGIYAECQVMVGNDSGPRHLAAAAKTPTVTLFGPEEPYEWHPYPVEQHPYCYVDGLSCRTNEGLPTRSGIKTRWCGISECKEFGHRCMTEIQVETVIEKCRRLLK